MFGKAIYSNINRLLNQKISEHGALIAVHRGSPGGNIIENTIAAYKAALRHGGDILEVDVAKSTDGVLYMFHDGAEDRLFHEPDNILTMDSARIDRLVYYNLLDKATHAKPERLSNVLSYFKGSDTLLNIDRAWDFFPELAAELEKHDMIDQIMLKSPVTEQILRFLDSCGQKYMFMPIVHSLQQIEAVLSYPNINVVGMELIADSESHPLFQDSVIERLHSLNLFVWANAINLDDDTVLYGRLDDDSSIIQSPELGWGKLLDKKIDVIQTDWPSILKAYIGSRS